MKKTFYIASAVVAALSVLSCNKEAGQSVEKPVDTVEGDFVVNASVAPTQDTRTSIDNYQTSWSEGDAITIFHNGNSDGRFILKEPYTTGEFTGTLKSELNQTNSWVAVYPYAAGAGLNAYPLNFVTVQTQKGANSTAHICGEGVPFYSTLADVAKDDIPTFTMHHMAAMLKVNITNPNSFPVSVRNVDFWNWIGDGSGNAALSGAFNADLTAGQPSLTKVSGESNVRLNVEGGVQIAAGESAAFYLATAPCTIPAEASITLYVNDHYNYAGGINKTIKLTENLPLEAGKVKTLNIDLEYPVLYVLGNAAGSSSFDDNLKMSNAEDPDIYTWTGHLSNDSFRLVFADDKNRAYIPNDGDHEISYANQALGYQFSDNPGDHMYWNAVAGNYKLEFNRKEQKLKVEAIKFDSNVPIATEVYLTGDFNSWGVKGDSEKKAPAQFTKEGDVYTLTIELEGGNKNTNLLLYGDGITNNWTGVAGSAVYMSKDKAVVKKYIRGAGVDGFSGIFVQDSGKYKITVDLTPPATISIEPVKY